MNGIEDLNMKVIIDIIVVASDIQLYKSRFVKRPEDKKVIKCKINITISNVTDYVKRTYNYKVDKDILRCIDRACIENRIDDMCRLYFVYLGPILSYIVDQRQKTNPQLINDEKMFGEVDMEIFERARMNVMNDGEVLKVSNIDLFREENLSKWDTSQVTKPYFKNHLPFYTTNNHKDDLSFDERKLLTEREFYRWKEQYLNGQIKFLEFTWDIDEDSIAMVRIRLQLSKGIEYYRTGIIDSIGKLHKQVRIRELQALYDRLVSERDIRERKVEGKWRLIQSASKISELPVINPEPNIVSKNDNGLKLHREANKIIEKYSNRPKPPTKPVGPRFRNTLM